MAGAEIESCFCAPELDGTAGIGCEPDDGAAQQLILPPQWQQAWADCREHAGIGAASNCAHTNNRPNRMALNRFTNLSTRKAAGANHFLAAAASWIFLMYLAGSLSKSFLHPGQHNLTSWP